MKVTQHILGQSIRFLTPTSTMEGRLYGVKLYRAFEDRYGFLQGPRVLSDFDLKNGITFLNGLFDRRVVIDRVQIYGNGILAEGKTSTDECDAFLDDVINWSAKEAGLEFVESDPNSMKLYLSQLELEVPKSLERSFQKYAEIGEVVGGFLLSYKQPYQQMYPAGILFSSDNAEHNRVPIKFERRAETPFSQNLYFSSAPLRTADHLKVISMIENLLI